METLKNFFNDESGQDLVEYSLLIVFIALCAITALPSLGKVVSNIFVQASSTIESGQKASGS